jgi:hypothetical protein
MTDERKETDDVSGAAVAALAGSVPALAGSVPALAGSVPALAGQAPARSGGAAADSAGAGHVHAAQGADPDATLDATDALAGAIEGAPDATVEMEPLEATALADPPPAVAELAAACVRFVAARYGILLDDPRRGGTIPGQEGDGAPAGEPFSPDTLSLVDQWVRDARLELKDNPSLVDLVQSAAGAYLGEVIRRTFGATWRVDGEHSEWRLMLATVYCAFNPIGMAREALLLGEADGWHAHFELDVADREEIEARLAALPEEREEDYYAPSMRFDVVHIVVEALREKARANALADVRFGPEDYAGV